MTEKSAPISKLANFSPVPRRAFADRRMKARHLKVLGAICVAVDSPTGTALISQKRVAHHAGMARQKVGDVIADLEKFGYIAPIRRGRSQRGRFKTNVYKILYEQAGSSCSEPDEHRVTPVGDMDRVTPGVDSTVSPPGVTESYLQGSNLSSSARPSEAREGANPPDDRAVEPSKDARQGDRGGSNNRAQGHISLPIRGGGAADRPVARQANRAGALNRLAKVSAETWERTTTNDASQRLCDALVKANPSGEWLALLSGEQWEAATDAERRRPGAGMAYARACLVNLGVAT